MSAPRECPHSDCSHKRPAELYSALITHIPVDICKTLIFLCRLAFKTCLTFKRQPFLWASFSVFLYSLAAYRKRYRRISKFTGQDHPPIGRNDAFKHSLPLLLIARFQNQPDSNALILLLIF